MRESSPPEAVSATGANGKPCVGADQERHGVGPGRARVALGDLGSELAFAEPDPVQLGLDCLRERLRGRAAGLREALRQRGAAFVRFRDRGCRCGERIGPVLERGQLGSSIRRSGKQLLVGLGPEPALRVRDPLELGLDLLQPVRLRLERIEEAAKLERRLPESNLDVAQLAGRGGELRRDLPGRGQRAFRTAYERRRAVALVRCQRGKCVVRSFGELGHVAQPLPLRAKRVLRARLEAFGVLHERAQLGEPGLLCGGALAQLLMAPAGSPELAPRGPQLGSEPQLLLPDERVEDVELVRRTREPALLELAGHRDQPLSRRREVFPGSASPPRVRARASVGEHAPRQHEPVLVLRLQLAQRLELVLVEQPRPQVELGLDVRLVGARPDEARVAFRAEQEPDRLREDRLARARSRR